MWMRSPEQNLPDRPCRIQRTRRVHPPGRRRPPSRARCWRHETGNSLFDGLAFSGERLFGPAETGEAQVRNKEIRQTTCVQKRLALASLALLFTGSPPPRVYPKPWTPGTAPREGTRCSESVTPHPRECVDLLAGGPLPCRGGGK